MPVAAFEFNGTFVKVDLPSGIFLPLWDILQNVRIPFFINAGIRVLGNIFLNKLTSSLCYIFAVVWDKCSYN